MTDVKDFGYLGNDFQLKLIAQIMYDRAFGLNIIPVLNPIYFDNQYYKQIISIIKEYNQKYDNCLPTITGLQEAVVAQSIDDVQKKYLVSIIHELKKKTSEDVQATQDLALKFCKQQEVLKAVNRVLKIVKRGDFESYDLIEETIVKSLRVADKKDDAIEVDDDIDDALSDDYRKPIPTGVDGIDEKIGGGLGKGELAAFLAPLGCGKAQPLYSKIYTPNGYKLMGDISVGDEILGSDGKVQHVTGVFPQEGLRKVYEVVFNDGTKTRCDENHLWSVKYNDNSVYETVSLNEILNIGLDKNFSIPSIGKSYIIFDIIDNNIGNEIKSNMISLGFDVDDLYHNGKRNIIIYLKNGQLKTIKEINFIGEEKTQCIMVSNDDHLYVTDDFILTHNTTFLTKIANTAYKMGYNVLQIFFEDPKKTIQRKHYACSSGIPLGELNKHKDLIKETRIKEKANGGKLILKKCPSDSTTTQHIRQYLRYQISRGINVDVLIIDYLDCLVAGKNSEDQTASESLIMRQLETIADEFQIAVWVAIQTNRCLTLDTLVDTPSGKIEIKNLKTGDLILTHKGFKKVEYVYPVTKQTVYKIKTKSGKEIKCSIKHMFPTTEGFKSISDDLKVGDKLFLKKEILYNNLSKNENELNYNDFIIDEIESIELIGEDETIDITVEDTHMFFANDIYTHNSGISADVVTTDQIQGSIKRAQVAHLIISVAKSLQQKEHKLATMAILKSRFGDDGIIFKDMTFRNDTIYFDTKESNLLYHLAYEDNKEKELDAAKTKTATDAMNAIRMQKKLLRQQGQTTN